MDTLNGDDLDAGEIRLRVARWMEELPFVAERLRHGVEHAGAASPGDSRTAVLERQIELLLSENLRLRQERAEIADAARHLVNFPLLNQVLRKLGAPPA